MSDKNWWRGASIYQIYPRSYQDSNGDGIGDLKGITRRLDHIAGLGVDAVWLSPFFTSPQLDFGYDVSDYKGVDPMFGNLEDFKALMARAKDLKLKIIIDLVLSHTSDQHPWFKQSRLSRDNDYADYYVWADAKPDGTPPNNWLSIFGGGAWEWEARRLQYFFHNFLKEQPDLNFHNPKVVEELLNVARFWLELGVDGFRLDTVNYYTHDPSLRDNPPFPDRLVSDVPRVNPYGWQDHIYDKSRPENLLFLEKLRAVMDEYGATTAVGEVGDGHKSLNTIAEYTRGQNRLHMCYAFEFLSPAFGKDHTAKTITAFENVAADSWACWAFSNHDVMRHASRWAGFIPDRETLSTFSIALLCGLRGSICLYQGEELGFTESELTFDQIQDPYGKVFWPEFKGRDGCRTPMAWEQKASQAGFSNANQTWLPVNPAHQQVAADTQVKNPQSIYSTYQSFLKLRNAHPALRQGDINILSSDADILAFERSGGNEKLLCVFNFANAPASYALPAGASLIAGSALRAEVKGNTLEFGPGGAAYLSLK
ncbi:alpha-glucosidase [Aestuariivirga litoralis]|uniref:alpha-glucosidase n=1 Tax=Aestuariivirga litoralis TaxID=2650924 RepID=UPI0018C643DA|nr:alpha-glucosidase [Aestuariivirga litoralis]MBG1232552.1 DUF3459 domain-containing protein [Aestuariivirga litoralis]